jgi:heme/copper-type cytochrome/quinol oxidase subunit 2
MSLATAFYIFMAAVILLLVAVAIACLHGKRFRERQSARPQDTEKGTKISAPTLATNPDALLFMLTSKAYRVRKRKPLPNFKEWI